MHGMYRDSDGIVHITNVRAVRSAMLEPYWKTLCTDWRHAVVTERLPSDSGPVTCMACIALR